MESRQCRSGVGNRGKVIVGMLKMLRADKQSRVERTVGRNNLGQKIVPILGKRLSMKRT